MCDESNPSSNDRLNDQLKDEDQQLAIERVERLLHTYTEGTMLVDALPYDQFYMIDPRTGALVMCIEEDMLAGQDIVLVVPQDLFRAPLRLSIELSTSIEEEACDRYLAYHQNQHNPIWAHGFINFAKLDSGEVLNQQEVQLPNEFISDHSGLCRKLNNDRKALREVCKLLSKTDIEEPTAVGIDPLGFDVRGPFGVVRVEFPARVTDARQAEEVLAALLGGVS